MPDARSTSSPATGATSHAGLVLSLAVATGMAASAAFVIRVVLIRNYAGDFANISRDYLWMTPVAYVLLFAAASLPVLAVARLLDATRATWLAAGTFATLGVFDAFMPITSIGRIAAFVLSMGVGVMIARQLASRAAVVVRGAWLFSMLIAIALGAAAFVTRRTMPGLSATVPPPGTPNVLLVILDTIRADELGLYGYAQPTSPELDRFAAQGVVFNAAMSTAPWTLPSHASIFTGRYPSSLSTDYKAPLDARDSTLAEVFGARGFATAGFVGNVWYTSWESGLQRGFQQYVDYQRSFEQLIKSTHFGRTDMVDMLFRSTSLREASRALRPAHLQEVPRPQPAPNHAEFIVKRFLEWQTSREAGRPWFAFLNFFDAHDPYLPQEPFRSRFGVTDPNATPRKAYDAEIAYLDSHLGRMLRDLEARGVLRNTVVVITADHGEHFGERRMTGHFNSIYMPLLHVPLILRFDGTLPAGRRVGGEVSLRDLGATILDLAKQPVPAAFGATSLRQRIDGNGETSPSVSSYLLTRNDSVRALDNGMLSIAEGGWHYIVSGRKMMEELYRYPTDPGEAVNLVGSDSGFARMPGMRQRLFRVLEADRRAVHR